ncbi:MAG: hypothetical protein Q8P57_03405 [Candidatus Pacearchaeota archaeon]|nr:hypothetical protein [Candidatus Pacearchaeota archaeon]
MVDRIQYESPRSQESDITRILLGTEKKGFFGSRTFTLEIPGKPTKPEYRTIDDAIDSITDYLGGATGFLEIIETPKLTEYCSRWGPRGGDRTPERRKLMMLGEIIYWYNTAIIAENKSKEQK